MLEIQAFHIVTLGCIVVAPGCYLSFLHNEFGSEVFITCLRWRNRHWKFGDPVLILFMEMIGTGISSLSPTQFWKSAK